MYTLWLILFFVTTATHAAEPPSNKQTSQWDFHQNDYDIKLERAVVVSFNRSFFKYFKADFVPVNRTQRVLNATIELIKEVPFNNAKLDVQVYKFMSNEYRFFPITISVNPCEEYSHNTLRSREILAKISNIRGCPVKPGYYIIGNGLPDFSIFPPLIPRGQYKMTTIWHSQSNFQVEMDFYGSVIDKPRKWK